MIATMVTAGILERHQAAAVDLPRDSVTSERAGAMATQAAKAAKATAIASRRPAVVRGEPARSVREAATSATMDPTLSR